MTPSELIESLRAKVDALVTKAGELNSSLLTTDDECIDNLKSEIEKATDELYDGIDDLSSYASTIKANEKW